MAAKSKPLDQVTAGDLGLNSIAAGQSIVSVDAAPARQAGEKVEDDGTAFERIVTYLEELKVI